VNARAVLIPHSEGLRGFSPGLGKVVLAVTAVAGLLGVAKGLEFGVALLELVGFVMVAVGLRRPGIGLVGIGMLCTLDAIARLILYLGGWLRFNTLNYWLIAVILLNAATLLRSREIEVRLFFALMLILMVGLLYSPGRFYGAQHVLNGISMLGILVYIRNAESSRASWFWLGAICGWIGAVVGAVFYLRLDEIRAAYAINMNAWVYTPITALIAICLAAASARPDRSRATLLALLGVVNAMWVFLSGSRGGMLAAMVCVGFLALTLEGPSVRLAALLGAVAAVAFVSTRFGERELYTVARVRTLLDPSSSITHRTNGHLDLALGGWYVFLDHPLGVGTGGFAPSWANMGSRENVSSFRYGNEMQAHSAWPKTLAENGLPGILCLVVFVGSFAWQGWRSHGVAMRRFGVFTTLTLATAFLAIEFSSKGLWLLAASAIVFLNPRSRPRRPATFANAPPARARSLGRIEAARTLPYRTVHGGASFSSEDDPVRPS